MSRRRPSRSHHGFIADTDTRLRKSKAWLGRLLARVNEVTLNVGGDTGGSTAVHYGMEALERRTMLTTFGDPTYGEPGQPNVALPDPFYYLGGGGQILAISYSTDVEFEALAAVGYQANATTGAPEAVLGNLIQVNPGSTGNPTLGADLFSIYVTQSTATSFISIYSVNVVTDPFAIVPTPFSGTIGSFQAQNAVTGNLLTVSVASGTGVVVVGGLIRTATPAPYPVDEGTVGASVITDPIEPTPTDVFSGITVIPVNTKTGAPNDFGDFVVGGTVFGRVSFGSNVNEFYAGSVLTGTVTGDLLPTDPKGEQDPTEISNFLVDGDLREFLTAGSVGTSIGGTPARPTYITDFDLDVMGRIGEVHIGNDEIGVTGANFAGTIEAVNSDYISRQVAYPVTSAANIFGYEFDQTEVDVVPAVSPEGANSNAILGELNFRNNSQADAQILGSIPVLDAVTGLPERDVDNNIIYRASVNGILQKSPADVNQDPIDYYGAALIAGQTVQVALVGGMLLQVIDPDGRIIASNALSVEGFQQFTADRPGLYLFQISYPGVTGVDFPYNLTITGLGNMGIGGIVVRGTMTDAGIDRGIVVSTGDLGEINVEGDYASTTLGPDQVLDSTGNVQLPRNAPASIVVADGTLRAVIASSIGTGVAGTVGSSDTGNSGVTFSSPVVLSIPNGGVGLIRATGTLPTSVLAIEGQFDPNTAQYVTDDTYARAIRGPIQDIDAAATLYAAIATDAGIGAIHAATMDTTTPSHIVVNADNTGFDGIIDLVDVSGQFGVLGDGGPEFVTNDGGNIRYMQLGGLVFLPVAFGAELDQSITYPAGNSETLTDDSGATYTVTANGPTTTGLINTSTGTSTTGTIGPQLTVFTYPVLDKAGEIPVSISSSGSLTVSSSAASGVSSSVDIGALSFTGIGRAITTTQAQTSTGVVTTNTDGNGNTSIQQIVPTGGVAGVQTGAIDDTTDEFLALTGSATINVLSVTATTSVAGNSPVEILNTTRGEVVSITSPGIGSIIVNGNLGFGIGQATPMQVMPRAVIAAGSVYPFVQQHTGVVLGTGFVVGVSSLNTTGDAVSIEVGGAVGNIDAGGTVQSLVADYDGKPLAGQLNGVVGPVVATRLLYVNVGQGLTATGTGLVGFSGLYATGKVGTVVSSGGDIRGNIVSAEDDTTERGIDGVSVSNASIIGSRIVTVLDLDGHAPDFAATTDLFNQVFIVSTNDQDFAPGFSPYVYDIGPISVAGDGGIIGMIVETGSVASVSVTSGGFGIFTSFIDGQNNGRLGSVTASGYGIRDSTFTAFGYIGPVAATGNGSLIPVTAYPLDVRPSDVPNGGIDTYFGIAPNPDIDIDAVLGATAVTPNIANVTDTGVIQDSIFNGARDLTSFTADKTRTALALFTEEVLPTPTLANIPVLGQTFPNSITFGGSVGTIKIRQVTDGFQITAGQLGKLSLGNSVNRIGISVAGNFAGLTLHGNLGAFITNPGTGASIPDSYIDAGGPNGSITSLKIYGNLNANVSATDSIGTIIVAGNLLGSVTAFGLTGGVVLKSLHVTGAVRDGSLQLDGNVGSIIVDGSLGSSAGALNISGGAVLISVGANHAAAGSNLALALTVGGTLKTLKVFGGMTGSVHTLGDLTNLRFTGKGGNITGSMQIDGRIGTANIYNANVASSIIAVGSINSFTINRGSVLAVGTVESEIDAIRSFKITGGAPFGLFGSLLAPSGLNDSIDISGNLGDGVDPAIVTAESGNLFHVRGSIEDHATVTLTFALNELQVNQNILAGAVITANPLKKPPRVGGTNDGTVIGVLT